MNIGMTEVEDPAVHMLLIFYCQTKACDYKQHCRLADVKIGRPDKLSESTLGKMLIRDKGGEEIHESRGNFARSNYPCRDSGFSEYCATNTITSHG
jgi:hypothetical protein